MIKNIKIKVKPKSSKREFVSLGNDSFLARLVAAPEKGKANKELIELAAKHFGAAKSCVRIVKGMKSCAKILEIVTH